MFSIESSTELCTGATAHHTHNKTRTTIEVAVVQSRSRVRDWLCPDTCPERQLDNLDHMMIGYRHPPLFTHEHGCVINHPTLHIRLFCDVFPAPTTRRYSPAVGAPDIAAR